MSLKKSMSFLSDIHGALFDTLGDMVDSDPLDAGWCEDVRATPRAPGD